MELTKEHRRALIHRLPNAIAERDRFQRMATTEGNGDVREAFEIDAFLRNVEIAAIEKAIEDNEIDY